MTMRPTYCIWLSALLVSGQRLAEAQVPQDRPELCSSANAISLPQGLTAVPTDTGVNLTLRLLDGSSKTIELAVGEEIRQVCPLDQERLMVFGVIAGGDGYIIWILRERDAALLDTIGARDPRLSPDQRWLIYRKRYPTHVELVNEEYLLYDLKVDAAANQPVGAHHGYAPGRLVYPVTRNRTRIEDLTPAPNRSHEFSGTAFFWSADSKSVAFADRVDKTTSIVVIRVGDEPTAYMHTLKIGDVCSGKGVSEDLMSSVVLSAVHFSSEMAGDVLVELSPAHWMDDRAFDCRRSIPLNSTNLNRADIEGQ